MVGLISAYIEHFTYVGLFVVLMLCGLGLPIPEDVALLAGGYLVHRGITRYPITLAVSLLGVVAGDNSLFFMGRRFGSGLVRYFSIGAARAPSIRSSGSRLSCSAMGIARFSTRGSWLVCARWFICRRDLSA